MQWVFYPIVGEGVIRFPENSKIESFNEFLRAIRAVNNDYKVIIVVLDNFSTHVSNRVKKRGRAARDVSCLPPTILA